MNSTELAVQLRRGAMPVAAAVAAGRVAIGLTALAAPSVPARPWVGGADDPPARVFGRALGARDLVLGAGALAALRNQPAGPGTGAGPAAAWVAAGAVADALDLAITVSAWPDLPRSGRWFIAAAAGGAAVAGAVAAGLLAMNRS